LVGSIFTCALRMRAGQCSLMRLAMLSFLLGGHSLFQLPDPVQDYGYLQRRGELLGALHHDEPLTVGSHIVIGPHGAASRETTVEETTRLAGRKRGARRHVDGHHRGAVSVEELVSTPGPGDLVATVSRDRDLLPRTRKRLHVDFTPAGLV